jgi:hypothetical protein
MKQILKSFVRNWRWGWGGAPWGGGGWVVKAITRTASTVKQDLLGQVSRLRKREGQKYVNFYGKS